ncbi:ferric-dicitrate binding protein FerR (iron transport regulator) [Pedobacter cryoconitis]|uniref:Ferric-dicitrate binding protein FerR (Iron transport regulator) n=1 Tax=Pedobacter cryoconitis TaxID=188932 RepID=A0A7W9DKV7_9SPHI|nr:FecR domain-containing protein [Pedobacter cryoconitis]MBB5622642.1 ferric-dicitrate binding protein FerR (iron transport regulator) [Pedobacter cryoconitis]MBB5648795.1 ferric-dicitrate binding protein FerR (iron transport regulator) [Pedobacter cryoconitis]
MENERAKKLIAKYLKGDCTAEEKAIVESWYLNETANAQEEIEEPDDQDMEQQIWAKITTENHKKSLSRQRIYSYAAAAILLLTTALYFGTRSTSPIPQNGAADFTKTDINPGGNKALLTLADGSKIVLDDAVNGQIAKQSGCVITKTTTGQLVYTIQDNQAAALKTQALLNTIETPKGGQYQVNLPDGTKVWLNAASSLSFPARFSGLQRQVILKGEAYFEVAKNKHMPFIVKSEQQKIEVLGTHFNVSAYADERQSKTTLAEGSVKVSLTANNQEQVLKPGQQAIANNHIKVIPVDIEEALAWKDGLFMFNDEDLENIMKKVERWYDVQVDFQQADLRQKHFSGTVSRFGKVSQILKTLELTGSVHFKIEGRKIIVVK